MMFQSPSTTTTSTTSLTTTSAVDDQSRPWCHSGPEPLKVSGEGYEATVQVPVVIGVTGVLAVELVFFCHCTAWWQKRNSDFRKSVPLGETRVRLQP